MVAFIKHFKFIWKISSISRTKLQDQSKSKIKVKINKDKVVVCP